MEEELIQLCHWLEEGKKTAIAIVVNKKGSALRQTGAKMIISEKGEIFGSVSGGCVESAVAEEALQCIRSRDIKLLHYGITDDAAWSVGLMCGGEIEVFIHPVLPESEIGIDRVIVEKLIELQQEKIPYVFLDFVDDKMAGQTCIVESHNGNLDRISTAWIDQGLTTKIQQVFDSGLSQIIETSKGLVFADVYKPNPRLVIIGAAHVSRALAEMARKLDYRIIIIDPRTAFATEERFSDVDEMLTIWPVEALEKIGLNSDDYVLLLSHDDKLDLPAAGKAIEIGVKYIGMLSSRTTRDRRFKLLQEEGYESNVLKNIHAPIGLDIGARSIDEIALSVLAEITAFRYGKVE